MADPTPKTPKDKPLTAERILHLQMLNVKRVYQYYARMKVSGHERGENTMMEMMFGSLDAANDLARAGKEWEPS